MLWIGGANTSWTRTIVRVETDEGIEGIAETNGGDATLVQLHALKNFFIGQDPFDRQKILRRLWHVSAAEGPPGNCAIQALETACWDIVGKALGQPLYRLLGGQVRATIPMIAYVFYRLPADGHAGERTPHQIVAYTEDVVQRHGLKTIKLKGGVRSPSEEYETMRALREAFPDHRLRFDPNGLWSVTTATRIGRRFEDLELEWYEDPVRGIEGMSRTRRDVRIPLATNMCCTRLDELPTAIRCGAIDIQLLDIDDWGGLTNAMKAAATCETFQIGVGLHASGEAGISTALYLHVASAFPSLPYAIDSLYHHQMDDVITEPHRYVDGCFVVPDKPGLGVEIDEDKLRHLTTLNQREGDRSAYGVAEVSWEQRLPGMW